MLKLEVPGGEWYNEKTEQFETTKSQILLLEHSLLSISKWESKWHKPFLSTSEKTFNESMDYVRCMTINKDVDPLIYETLTSDLYAKINSYIDDKMTATWFSKPPGNGRASREIITAEIIYYWMVTLGIPFECEKWHLNRLLTLIQVCNEKNAPAQKMGRKEQMAQQRALNAARRSRMRSRG